MQKAGRKSVSEFPDMYLKDRSTLRRIGQKESCSQVTVMKHIHEALEDLEYVHRGWTTGFLVLDGKALSIGGRDTCEHLVLDADGTLLARSLEMGKESAAVFGCMIDQLKADGLNISAVTTDGLPGLQREMKKLHLIHQRCHVHLLRDLRVGLQLTVRHRYKRQAPSNRQKRVLYRYAHLLLQSSPKTFRLRLEHVTRCLSLNLFCINPIQLQALRRFLHTAQIHGFWHFHDERIPATTNAVENYISRFNARLKTMRGMKKFENADRILTGLHLNLNWT
ncbi:transposase [Patescibacteria group bacterium]|nr:transposase [Patescibacteria group bacterium]